MCWNAEVSFESFGLGLLGMVLAHQMGYSLSMLLFFATIVFMQLIEGIVWSYGEDPDVNEGASLGAAALLMLQPVASILALSPTRYQVPMLVAYAILGILAKVVDDDGRTWREKYRMDTGRALAGCLPVGFVHDASLQDTSLQDASLHNGASIHDASLYNGASLHDASLHNGASIHRCRGPGGGVSVPLRGLGGGKTEGRSGPPLIWKWLTPLPVWSLLVYFVFLLGPLFFTTQYELLVVVLVTLGFSMVSFGSGWGSMWCWLVNLGVVGVGVKALL